MFTPIRHILPETLKKKALKSRPDRPQVIVIFERSARAALPPDAVGTFKVMHLIDGTLTVACKTSAVAQLLRQAEAGIRQSVAKAGEEIGRIRFLLAPWR